jgi:hypothetical protein
MMWSQRDVPVVRGLAGEVRRGVHGLRSERVCTWGADDDDVGKRAGEILRDLSQHLPE